MNLTKNYYTPKEVSKITGIKEYTLRYWEDKLKIIKPIRLNSRHRRYTVKDIENIIKIKEMLDCGYSFNGIKNILYRKKKVYETKESDKSKELLKKINEEIKNIINDFS